MEIPEIKQRLTLATVLKYYGLTPDKNMRLCCPFHADKTPSMQVYYKTHSAYCFSSNCKTHGKSLDVIDFIMHKENLTKAGAIQKAALLSGGANGGPASNPDTSAGKTGSGAGSYFAGYVRLLPQRGAQQQACPRLYREPGA
jgi:DNA primase